MTTSIITNGMSPIHVYEKCYREWGLDHLHISSHGMGDTLDTIAQRKGAGDKQRKLKEWLKAEQLPFRTNVTLQQTNYEQVPDIIAEDMELGSFHCVMLGFISIYEWSDPATTAKVAVHPNLLRPYIEKAAKLLKDKNHLFTIRYHPLCHLDPAYWPHVVNARYVFFDPYEWNYALQADDIPALWKASKQMGNTLAAQEPCSSCTAFRHCGGWNKVTATGTGANLAAIYDAPAQYSSVWGTDGGLHDLNPVNHLHGITPDFVPDSRRGKPQAWELMEPIAVEEVIKDPRSLELVK
jgi:MoaA/NifB/PqqE/SkfB family radical SAM enzyme